jgi:hypothetical protein
MPYFEGTLFEIISLKKSKSFTRQRLGTGYAKVYVKCIRMRVGNPDPDMGGASKRKLENFMFERNIPLYCSAGWMLYPGRP